MLTKEQYDFLNEFKKVTRKSKEKDEQLKLTNRETIDVEAFSKLLSKHSELYPTEPFDNERNQDDKLEGSNLALFINTYLNETGLKDCFEYFQPNLYGLSQIGMQKMSDYKIEYFSKIKLPIISIIISAIALLISIASLCIKK